jgi:hypothetical protein
MEIRRIFPYSRDAFGTTLRCSNRSLSELAFATKKSISKPQIDRFEDCRHFPKNGLISYKASPSSFCPRWRDLGIWRTNHLVSRKVRVFDSIKEMVFTSPAIYEDLPFSPRPSPLVFNQPAQ